MEASILNLQQLLERNSLATPLAPPPVVQRPVEPIQSQQSTLVDFLPQMKLMKEMMQLMLPQPQPTIVQPVAPTNSNDPTFSLEAMERIAKMFQR